MAETTGSRSARESVWDYPRPPRIAAVKLPIRVVFAGTIIASSTRGLRVLETSHPPTYYFHPDDVRTDLMEPAEYGSFCEFKGRARYWSLVADGRRSSRAAWSYPEPTAAFQPIAGYFAFYACRVDACYVGDERVVAQSGDFYGGWVTSDIEGPFKGGPGTRGW